MRRMLFIPGRALVLALVACVAALALAATPALAGTYPAEYVPSTAYIHPYDGPTWAYWEEFDADGNWAIWDIDTTPNEWWPELPYKAIPAGYTVYFAAVLQAVPRGIVAAMPGNCLFDFTIGAQHVGWKEAKGYWSAPMQIEGWEMPTINRELALTWEIGWLYPVAVTPGTTYAGSMSYQYKHPMIDMIVWDAENPDQNTPAHIGKFSSTGTYSFTVAP